MKMKRQSLDFYSQEIFGNLVMFLINLFIFTISYFCLLSLGCSLLLGELPLGNFTLHAELMSAIAPPHIYS